MNSGIMHNRKIILLSVMVVTVSFFARCIQAIPSPDPRGPEYSGSSKCVNCHQEISYSYAHTAHFLSTQIANEKTVKGNFSNDSNELWINDSTRIMMEKRDSGLYQVLYLNNKQETQRRFDLLMGTSKVQAFFYWQNDGFFQLPVFYYINKHAWASSPGTAASKINFNRPAVNACFQCHSSFSNGDPHGISVAVAKQQNWVFNIDCERCHGPAAAHVQFHESHPDEKQSRFLTSFQSLVKSRKVELCAVCHSGTGNIIIKSTAGFKMGDTLESYMSVIPDNTSSPDIHGNLTRQLSLSKCFRMGDMDCSTCHNAHVNEKEVSKNFNESCQHCHSPGQHFCGLADKTDITFLKSNCTACHMPAQTSVSLLVQAGNHSSEDSMKIVNHRIAVYPVETEMVFKTISHLH